MNSCLVLKCIIKKSCRCYKYTKQKILNFYYDYIYEYSIKKQYANDDDSELIRYSSAIDKQEDILYKEQPTFVTLEQYDKKDYTSINIISDNQKENNTSNIESDNTSESSSDYNSESNDIHNETPNDIDTSDYWDIIDPILS